MGDSEKPFSFRISEEDEKAFEAAAAEVGLPVRAWARLMCRAAAGAALPKQLDRAKQLHAALAEGRKLPIKDGTW